jgi:hypothetical protein
MLSGTTGTDIFSVEVRSQLAIEKASNPGRIKAGKLFFIMLAFERVKVRTESSRLTTIRRKSVSPISAFLREGHPIKRKHEFFIIETG